MGESEAGEVAVSEASESGDRARGGGEREVGCDEVVTKLKLTRVATRVRVEARVNNLE